MLKRKPQLYNPNLLQKISSNSTNQIGGDISNDKYPFIQQNNKFSFITNTIIPFIKKYYIPIIIFLIIAVFLYWRYYTKLEEERKLQLLLLTQLQKEKKKNNNFLHPQVSTNLPPAKKNNHEFQLNNQKISTCTSCNNHDNLPNQNVDELIFRNNKGNLDTNITNYYGQSITEDNYNDPNNMFTPSNGMGDHYFSIQ